MMRRTEKRNLGKKVKRLGTAATDWRKMTTMAGGWLTRFGVRATIITGAVDFLNYGAYVVGNVLDKEWGAPLNEAFNFSKVGLGILGLGLATKYIPNILSSNLEDVAQAGSINSMEDNRKEGAINHLSHLWKRVFETEARLTYTTTKIEEERKFIKEQIKKLNLKLEEVLDFQLREFLGVPLKNNEKNKAINNLINGMIYANPFTDRLEKSFPGFLISSMHALSHPMSRARLEEVIGYKIWQLVDWYDGGPLDKSDTKLREVFKGDSILKEIKKETPYCSLIRLSEIPKTVKQNTLFFYNTRMLAIEAVKAAKKLNYDYRTNKFTAQLLLYPGDENLKFLNNLKPREEDLPPAREGLLNSREILIKRRLGKTFEDANNILDDMILPSFEKATNLRRAYDVEYIDDPNNRTEFAINYGLVGDLEAVGCCQKDRRHCEKIIVKPRRELVLFTDYLRGSMPQLFEWENAKMLRAMRTAFHINKWGMKEDFNRLSYVFGNKVDRVEKAEPAFSERLETLRFHQTLTILETVGYQNLLQELAYSNKN